MTFSDQRQHAPATERNRQPILTVLEAVLPATGTILEIASGTGEHAVYLAPHLQPRQWLPTDINPLAINSISAWREVLPSKNVHPPLQLDITTLPESWGNLPPWTQALLAQSPLTAMVSINMIHIAPWSACLGLMATAGKLLREDGVLYLYGPFRREGVTTAPSNEAFDQSLRLSNSEWGLRHLEEVVAVAQQHDLMLLDVVPMPANNLSVIFRHN
jgi:hypothetical protein